MIELSFGGDMWVRTKITLLPCWMRHLPTYDYFVTCSGSPTEEPPGARGVCGGVRTTKEAVITCSLLIVMNSRNLFVFFFFAKETRCVRVLNSLTSRPRYSVAASCDRWSWVSISFGVPRNISWFPKEKHTCMSIKLILRNPTVFPSGVPYFG